MPTDKNTPKTKIYEVSTAHLDTVWNWDLTETVKKFLVNTFTINLDFFEKYPNYVFNFEGAYRYDLIKEYYPEAYEKIREKIAQGRWYVTGSSWENGDVVTPEPETLMRNILYGNLYFEEDFGKVSNDIFLPDCFGFPWTLPTIMRHMGLTSFSSQKLSWNPACGGQPPFHVGRWQGIDGAEVIAAVDPGPYGRGITEPIHENKALVDMVSALPLQRDIRYYGTGDQGGAPSEDSAVFINEAVAKNAADPNVEVIAAYAGQLADELTEAEKAQLPSYNGDLLMVTHGVGSYSSVAPTKRFHRSNEMKADVAEKLNVMGEWLGAVEYPRAALRKLWCDFIRHEFHDDLTGTSCARAYRETFHDDIVVNNRLDGEIEAAFRALVANVDTTPGAAGERLVVFNPCAAARRALVRAVLPYGKKKAASLVVTTPDGALCPTQITAEKDGKATVLFVADLPSVGYATFVLCEGASVPSTLSVTERTLESARYAVTLNDAGDIASVFDKKNGRELLSSPIHFELLRNHFVHYGSWEITYDDEVAAPYAVVTGPADFEIVENGPARAAIRVTRYFGASRFEQTLSLDAADGALRVDNVIVWGELSTLLKCAFPLNLSAETARFDRGLGSVECPDRAPALYEVPVHKWANMYDAGANYSATIVNDCKYGMDKCGSVLRLTCIHTPDNHYADATAQDVQDHGRNEFAFAIGGDRGDFVAARAEEQGIFFNQAPISVLTDIHGGALPCASAFASVSPCLSLKALKKAEKSDEYIVRVVESTGKKQDKVTVSLGNGIASFRPVNGYEKPVTDDSAVLNNGVLSFAIGAFEPKTFAIKLKNAADSAAKTQYSAVSFDADVPFTSSDEHRGEYGFGAELTTVPRRLMTGDMRVCDVPLTMCEKDGQFVCAYAANQTFAVPAGADTLYLMATRLGPDAPYTVQVDGKPVTFDLQSLTDDIGGWDQYACNHRGFIRESRVAFCASHVHDVTGDRVYGRFSWYLIPVCVKGAKTVTLPADSDVLLAAATFALGPVPTTFASDIAFHKAKPAMHHLTVVGGLGSGDYMSETPVHVILTGNFGKDVVWHASTGETYIGAEIGFVMPDCDVTLTPASVGALGREIIPTGSAYATTAYDAAHGADKILDGALDTCWMSGSENVNELIVDLGRIETPEHIVLLHAGPVLGAIWRNTFDFAADYLCGAEWRPLFTVKGNLQSLTIHSFAPVQTQFVRIRMQHGTMKVNDNRSALCRVWFFAGDAPVPAFTKAAVTAFDLAQHFGTDETLFAGTVQAGQSIRFPHPVVVRNWHMNACAATLAFCDENGSCLFRDSATDVVKKNDISRAMAQLRVSSIRVEALDGTADLTVYGSACPFVVAKQYNATDASGNGTLACGSRNPFFTKRADGTVLLPVCEGEHHDLYGLHYDLPAGNFTLYVKVRVPEEELKTAADDTPLFFITPRMNNQVEINGHPFTVAEYKAAMADGNGYRTFYETFNTEVNARIEARIWNKRNLPLEIEAVGFCGSEMM